MIERMWLIDVGSDDWPFDILKDKDNDQEFIVCGKLNSTYIFKVDINGNLKWAKRIIKSTTDSKGKKTYTLFKSMLNVHDWYWAGGHTKQYSGDDKG